uniref:Uncharacterized protein n=1 Tax=Arundo donax TaxID=35708 RepID=A0A0A9F7E7_ARUDO
MLVAPLPRAPWPAARRTGNWRRSRALPAQGWPPRRGPRNRARTWPLRLRRRFPPRTPAPKWTPVGKPVPPAPHARMRRNRRRVPMPVLSRRPGWPVPGRLSGANLSPTATASQLLLAWSRRGRVGKSAGGARTSQLSM